MSKVLVVNSSYRKNSNSSALGLRVAAGAVAAGKQVEVIDIGHLRIDPCRGCDACRRKPENFCVIKDDMQQFYARLLDAATLIFVGPVYWFNMNGQMKQFIDRLYAISSSLEPDGPSRLADKKIGAAFAYEGDDPMDSGCVNAIRCFQDICAYTGAKWLGAIYGSAWAEGDILNNTEVLVQAEEFGKNI